MSKPVKGEVRMDRLFTNDFLFVGRGLLGSAFFIK